VHWEEVKLSLAPVKGGTDMVYAGTLTGNVGLAGKPLRACGLVLNELQSNLEPQEDAPEGLPCANVTAT
jgi:hypothetical protein